MVPFFIIAGAPGAGKSTIAPILAKTFDYDFFEGSALVSQEDIKAISRGTPMTESAYTQWMIDVVNTAYRFEKESSSKGIVGTCTALERKVRTIARNQSKKLSEEGSKLKLIFIWLEINKEESLRRTKMRTGHYYNPEMTEWIFSLTETPHVEGNEKEENAYIVDASQKVEEVVADALQIISGVVQAS